MRRSFFEPLRANPLAAQAARCLRRGMDVLVAASVVGLGGEATCAANAPARAAARLDRWRLETVEALSETGAKPVVVQGWERVEGLDGGALRARATDRRTILRLPARTAAGQPLLGSREGTLRFLFRPDWSTAGGGPGEDAVLLQSGAAGRPGSWALRIPATGRALEWVDLGSGGGTNLVARGTVHWASNLWTAIDVTWSDRAPCRLLTNGVPCGDAAFAAKPLPGAAAAERASGDDWWVGSDAEGRRPARGAFDELESFRQALPETWLRSDYSTGMSARVDEAPPRVHLSWRFVPGQSGTLRRRGANDPGWTVVATNLTRWSYVDSQVQSGERYEYYLEINRMFESRWDRYLPVGLDVAASHRRGTVLVLVDRTVAGGIEAELDQWATDVVAEGWRVLRREVPRHDDQNWAHNTNAIADLKALVNAQYAALGSDLRALFLLGHVPIPHSGSLRPDGHHSRPMPADGYYGDTVSGPDDWPDRQADRPTPDPVGSNPGIPNRADDGVFDPIRWPSPIEVPVGRVDFANLPAFTGPSTNSSRRVSEVGLLQRYLRKARLYRRGELRFEPRIAAFEAVPGSPTAPMTERAIRNGVAWFGSDPGWLDYRDIFRGPKADSWLWGMEFGYGSSIGIGMGNLNHQWTTENLARSEPGGRVGFFMVDGSYLGDWNTVRGPDRDVFLKALIAPEQSGLGALWVRMQIRPVSLQGLGLGDPLGVALARAYADLTVRDSIEWSFGNVFFSLLGDPTLTQVHLTPVSGLSARSRGRVVRLTWDPDPDPTTRYFVYRSRSGLEGPFDPLVLEPLENTEFIDPDRVRGRRMYLVRPTRRVVTGCGSYHDLGPGSFATVR